MPGTRRNSVKTGAIPTNRPCSHCVSEGEITMGWFGPSKDEVWRELCRQIGGQLIDGGFWKGNKVQVESRVWTVTLDTFAVSNGKTQTTYTRLRAPFLSVLDFRFSIYRESAFTALGKWFGMQDIEVGGQEFDDDFVIKGNNESLVRDLFASPEIRRLIQAQPRVRLEVKDGQGWLGPRYPRDVDELQFLEAGIIKDVDRLRALFDLFAVVLDRLCEIGVVRRETPGVTPR